MILIGANACVAKFSNTHRHPFHADCTSTPHPAKPVLPWRPAASCTRNGAVYRRRRRLHGHGRGLLIDRFRAPGKVCDDDECECPKWAESNADKSDTFWRMQQRGGCGNVWFTHSYQYAIVFRSALLITQWKFNNNNIQQGQGECLSALGLVWNLCTPAGLDTAFEIQNAESTAVRKSWIVYWFVNTQWFRWIWAGGNIDYYYSFGVGVYVCVCPLCVCYFMPS